MQAARGTSLSDSELPPTSGRPVQVLFWGTVVVLLAIDQLTKWLAVEHLRGREPIALVGDLLSLSFLRNPGAAFGTGSSMTLVLTVIAAVVVGYVIFTARTLRDRGWAIGLALLLGGALGNLVDRIFREPGALRGHVVDFIDYNGMFVGNVADIWLTFAALVLIWRSWSGVHMDGTRE